MQQPLDVFRWLDVNVRSPNKLLITTRHHDFKGDYPIEVESMTREECNQLIAQTANQLGIASWITSDYQAELYTEAAGHPYVIKILLGEARKAGRRVKTERIFAVKDQILDALFERTYARLSPAARRTFLTLSNWGTATPQLAVEAVLLQAKEGRFDVTTAIDELVFSSFITRTQGNSDQLPVIDLPVVAEIFGRKKLSVEPMKIEVDEDTALLRVLASPTTDSATTIVEKIFKNVARQLESGTVRLTDMRPLLEFISSRIPHGWFLLSQLHEESNEDTGFKDAKAAIRRYLEVTPRGLAQLRPWERLSDLCERAEDFTGWIDAQASLCELPGLALQRISNAALHVLTTVRKPRYLAQPLDIRRRVKQTIPRIIAILTERADECAVADLTRLAWLCLLVGDQEGARTWTGRGLAIEPDNVHCLSLAQRLGVQPGKKAAKP
jgi:hypothetical protein